MTLIGKLVSGLFGLLILAVAVWVRLQWYEEEYNKMHVRSSMSNPPGDTHWFDPTPFRAWLRRFLTTVCLAALGLSCVLVFLSLFFEVPAAWHLYADLGGPMLLILIVKWWSDTYVGVNY